MTPEKDELDKWHRFFAIQNNNLAWDLASHAHSAAVAGESAVHLERYRAAVEAIAAISDQEDRDIVLQTFKQVPVPGSDA